MQEADHILIPLLDGTHALAQVVRVNDTRALIHLTEGRATADSKTSQINAGDVVATLVIDRTALAAEHWPVIGYEARPNGLTTDPGDLTGPDPLDPAIVEAFANACQGLYPWDGFPDPAFFANLLRVPGAIPSRARMAADFPQPTS